MSPVVGGVDGDVIDVACDYWLESNCLSAQLEAKVAEFIGHELTDSDRARLWFGLYAQMRRRGLRRPNVKGRLPRVVDVTGAPDRGRSRSRTVSHNVLLTAAKKAAKRVRWTAKTFGGEALPNSYKYSASAEYGLVLAIAGTAFVFHRRTYAAKKPRGGWLWSPAIARMATGGIDDAARLFVWASDEQQEGCPFEFAPELLSECARQLRARMGCA